MNAAIFIGILTFLAMGTLLIAYIQHICGMFKIAWYGYKNSYKNYAKQYLLSQNYKNWKQFILKQ